MPASAIPDGWMGLDIGPDSVKSFSEALDTTQTIIWNGPMGVFEFDKFAVGTEVCMQEHPPTHEIPFKFYVKPKFTVNIKNVHSKRCILRGICSRG